MDSHTERTIKSTQEQAVASWIDYLNQIRLERLVRLLHLQDINLENALDYLEEAKQELSHILSTNRGGEKGIHGFIAEIFECAFGNADSAINGETAGYNWINDNGEIDIIKFGIAIQQKFSRGNGHFGLEKIREHLEKYPDFLKNGGKYQLPKDFYTYVKRVAEMSDEEISKLTNNEADGLNYKIAKWIKEFFEKESITIDDIEPSQLTYAEVQRDAAAGTLEHKKQEIYKKDRENRKAAQMKTRPTLKEGVKAAGVSTAIEGGTAFALAVASKLKQGKKLADFTDDDWKDVGFETGKGAVKGGIRGGAIYGLTNYTHVPANVACAFITASFGIASQIHSFEGGKMPAEDCLINCETICLDSAISAISAMAGQLVVPVPVLGAIIGSFVGNIIYTNAQKIGSKRTQNLAKKYQEEVNAVIVLLDAQYALCLKRLQEQFAQFKSIEKLAFSDDINNAFDGSQKLALFVGVSSEDVLSSVDQIDDFFLS